MRLQSLVVALLFVVAGAFVVLNLDVVMEPRSIQLPGAQLTGPILGVTLIVALSALIGMLLLRLADGVSASRAQRRLHQRIAQRDHEIALMKSAAYDRVAATVEAVHREVSTWIEGEARRQEHLQSQLAALQRTLQPRALPEAAPEVEVRRAPAEREAA